ncbi:autophagy protein Atg22 [Aspergillus sp. HF37]|nr:autophagy protein Atg22 [Aspergillus sp. HF37]
MISELMPRGYDNMFFALFGITNRASSIIGPNVIQAIINRTHNNWMGFPFLFAICAAAMITIWFVDVEKGREDARKFAESRKLARVTAENDQSRNAALECAVDEQFDQAKTGAGARARKGSGPSTNASVEV